ncbi:MAG TPA: hypothetical protein VK646_11560 [Actinomycetota bacterium]|nr:hypothetical protein [Actinomycetota bacterium]
MNQYLLSLQAGGSTEIEAESYQRDGDDWVFFDHGEEVARLKADEVESITRFRI